MTTSTIKKSHNFYLKVIILLSVFVTIPASAEWSWYVRTSFTQNSPVFQTYQEAVDWMTETAEKYGVSSDLVYRMEFTEVEQLFAGGQAEFVRRFFSDNYPLPIQKILEGRHANGTFYGCSEWTQGVPGARIYNIKHVLYGPDSVMPPAIKPDIAYSYHNNCIQTALNAHWRIVALPVIEIAQVDAAPGASHPAPGHQQCEAESNPCNPASGNKLQIETDYKSNMPFGLSFSRTYNSMGSNRTAFYQGRGWRHNYSSIMDQRGAPPSVHTITRSSGAVYYFDFVNGQWSSTHHPETSLQELSDGWLFIDENDIREEYNTSGQLVKMEHPSGWTKILSYDLSTGQGGDNDDATLDKVVGPFGRELTFQYNAGYLSQVTTPDGDITYNVDINSNLTIVTYPDNQTRQYHYENTSFPHHLTGITDANGDRFSTWDYDSEGRTILSKHALDTEKVSFAYNSDGTTTVTDPLSGTHTYTFEPVKGSLKMNDTTGQRCLTCKRNPNIKSQSYTPEGFVASRTDWENNQTTYTYNARGLEEERIEAVGTPQQRKTVTQWHMNFRVPIQIDVFDHNNTLIKRTTNTYDTQGRRLNQTIESL